jgi:hypothetical protein
MDAQLLLRPEYKCSELEIPQEQAEPDELHSDTESETGSGEFEDSSLVEFNHKNCNENSGEKIYSGRFSQTLTVSEFR